jgi:hypothetical protein
MLDLCGAVYNNDKGKTYILPNPTNEIRTIKVPGQQGEPDTEFKLFNPEWLMDFKKSSVTRDYIDQSVLRVINNNKVSCEWQKVRKMTDWYCCCRIIHRVMSLRTF